MTVGWKLLQAGADFLRDYLLSTPANYQGFGRSEMKYETGFALQNRVLTSTAVGVERVFNRQVTQCWTPHSGRSYFPSATAILFIFQKDTDFLGGWSATGCDRNARMARARIANMQTAVVRLIHESTAANPLGESETIKDVLDDLGDDG